MGQEVLSELQAITYRLDKVIELLEAALEIFREIGGEIEGMEDED